MPDYEIRSRVALMGDKEYKTAISDISRSIKVLKTDLQASQSAFKGQDASMEALTDKRSKLSAVYEEQAQKVEMMAAKLDEAKNSENASQKEIDNLTIALNKAKAEMNTTGAEIAATDKAMQELDAASKETGESTEELGENLDKAGDGAEHEGESSEDAAEKSHKLADALKSVGSLAAGACKAGLEMAANAAMALGKGAVEATQAAFDMAKGAGTYADDLLTLSTQTGISAEELQGWSYAARFIDTDVDTITKSMARMTREVGNAGNGSKSSAEKFKALGVSIKDSNGNIKDAQTIFYEAIDALGKMENETERDAAAMNLFGKSAQELNPLIEAGGEALKDLSWEALNMGTVFSDDALSAMGAFDDSMQRVQASSDGLKTAIGLAVIPAFQGLTDKAAETMGTVSHMLQDGIQPGDISNITNTVTTACVGMLDEIAGTIETVTPEISGAVDTIVSSLGEALPNMVDVIAPAAMELLTGALGTIADNTEPLITLASDLVTKLGGYLVDNLDTLTTEAAGILTGIIDGITGALPDLIPLATDIITGLASALTENLPSLLSSGGDLLAGLIDGIVEALPDLITCAADIISNLGTYIAENLPDLLAKGGEILAKIIEGIGEALPTLATAAVDIVVNLATALVENMPQLIDKGKEFVGKIGEGIEAAWEDIKTAAAGIGTKIKEALGEIDLVEDAKQILTGLKNGLETAWNDLKENIKGVFKDIWQAIKDVFGIHSPSTEAESAGKLILDGLVLGFQNAVDAVCETVKAIFGKIWDAIKSIFGFGGESEESKDAKKAGEDIMSGMQEGIEDSEDDLKNAVANLAKDVLAKMKTEFGVSEGPSTKTKPYGESIAKGIVEGLKSVEADDFSSGAKAMYNAVNDAIGEAFGVEGTGWFGMGEDSAKKFEAIGESICKALADGINGENANTAVLADAMTGVANAAYEAAVAGMETGLSGGTDTVNAAVEAVAQAALDKAAELLTDKAGAKSGEAFAGGIRTGIDDQRDAVETAAHDAAQAALDAVASTLDYGGDLAEAARPMGAAVANAINQGMQDAGTPATMSGGAQAVHNAVDNALKDSLGVYGSSASRFEYIGTAIAQGVANGIRGGSYLISSAARSAAQSAYNAAKSELGIASPSKKMAEIGRYYDEGFAQGIEKNMRAVTDSAARLSNMAASTTAATRAERTALSIDYDRLGVAVAEANRRAGVGNSVLAVDGRTLGETIEPSVARTTWRRKGQSVTGRSARMVLV